MAPEPEPDVPQGGVFTRLWADPPTLDPARTGDTRSAGIVVEIFSGLVTFDIDLKARKRYLDLVATAGNGTLGTFMAAWCVLSRAGETPMSAADRNESQILRV